MEDEPAALHISRVVLDIGGQLFVTSSSTLTKVPDTMFSSMFSGRYAVKTEKDGSYFIDRDGTHFRWILNYLRDPTTIEILEDKAILSEVLIEARYYSIEPLVDAIEQKLGFGKKTVVLYISSVDGHTSSPEVFTRLNTNLLMRVVPFDTYWANYNVEDVDTIFVTAHKETDSEGMGNFLADCVDAGINVVICYLANCSNFEYPAGRFGEDYHPLVPGPWDKRKVATLGNIHFVQHPIMKGVRVIDLSLKDFRRPFTTVSKYGNVQRIADWNDGWPMVATRLDKQGLVTSITFYVGNDGGGEGDATRLVTNALYLKRSQLHMFS